MKKEILIIPCGKKRLYGELFLPEDSVLSRLNGSLPLLISSHGFNGSYEHNEDYAAYLADRGFAVYRYDFYGGSNKSKSGGSMKEMSVLTEAEELTRVIEFFRDRDDIDSRRIFLWGNSQGGFVSTYVACKHPDWVRGMILLYPAYVIPDMVKVIVEKYGYMPEEYSQWDCVTGKIYGTDALSFDIFEMMKNYNGPVLMVHGDQDDMVPLVYTEKAMDYFSRAKRVVLQGAGHGFEGAHRDKMKEMAAAFLMEHVM